MAAVVAGGDGLARSDDGRVTFVRGALPGERVRVEVVERKRDFSRAVVVEVLEPSDDRVDAPCPLVASGCGGCDWQHVTAEGQRRLRTSIVEDALRRQARLDLTVDPGPDLPALGHRTILRGESLDGTFSLRRRSSHDLVAIGPCMVAHPLLEELIFEGRFPAGGVILRAGARTGERLVVVDGDPGEVRVPSDVHVVSDAQLRSGTRAWYHEELAGRRWRVSARSFFQARPDGAEALVDLVRLAVGGTADDRRLVDLYGGVGLFAGTIASSHATLVEFGASSIADARINLADVDHRVVKTDVTHWGPTRADVVVADPPRAGLGATGVAKVGATGADRLALISCDPAALGRDARLLQDAGFELRTATVVDLFSHTSHVEVVSRFDRISPA